MNDSIQIQKGDVSITCTDPAQAAQLVNLLIGVTPAAAASAAPPPVAERKRPGPKPRAKEAAPAASTGDLSEQATNILAFVRKAHSRMLGEIATHVYGDADQGSRGNANVALGKLVKSGHLQRVGRGEYAVARV